MVFPSQRVNHTVWEYTVVIGKKGWLTHQKVELTNEKGRLTNEKVYSQTRRVDLPAKGATVPTIDWFCQLVYWLTYQQNVKKMVGFAWKGWFIMAINWLTLGQLILRKVHDWVTATSRKPETRPSPWSPMVGCVQRGGCFRTDALGGYPPLLDLPYTQIIRMVTYHWLTQRWLAGPCHSSSMWVCFEPIFVCHDGYEPVEHACFKRHRCVCVCPGLCL